MNKKERALACFENNFNCSQAVCSVFAEDFELPKEQALKIACAFGGGLGRQGHVCGAVSGALMTIGLKHGKFKNNDTASKDKTYQLTEKFISNFKQKFGSIDCNNLLKEDISTDEGYNAAREKGLFKEVCPTYVGFAVTILEDIL